MNALIRLFCLISLVLSLSQPCKALKAIVAYSTDTTVFPLDNDSTVFTPGVSDLTVQRLLNKYEVTYYKRPFWRNTDSMSHQIIITCKGDIYALADSLKVTGKYYELSIEEITLNAHRPDLELPKLKLYPNPASDQFIVELTYKPQHIKLLDCNGLGIPIRRRFISPLKCSIELADSIPPGVYRLYLSYGNQGPDYYPLLITD